MRTIIHCPSDRADHKLEALSAGKDSTRTVWVKCADEEADEIFIRIWRKATAEDTDEPVPYDVPGVQETNGVWRVYLPSYCFPLVADDLMYRVIGKDLKGETRDLGGGNLRVLETHLSEGGIAPTILPNNTYVRNPTTGLWHKLIATVDESGVISIAVDQEGIEK